ncbi:MAG: carbonic anhydrase [Myxococcota bacterium]
MKKLPQLFERNRTWAAARTQDDPQFFERLAGQQSPAYLWIGCADSRVPATQIVDLAPGEMFVHRNVANVVTAADLNIQAVLQYAIDYLKVHHVIVCGHYGCGGIEALDELSAEDKYIPIWLNNAYKAIPVRLTPRAAPQ